MKACLLQSLFNLEKHLTKLKTGCLKTKELRSFIAKMELLRI